MQLYRAADQAVKPLEERIEEEAQVLILRKLA